MSTLSPTEVAVIANRYPDVFKKGRFSQIVPIAGMVALALYFVFVWSFFSMNEVLSRANWDVAGNYLADWISYESRPDIELEDGYLLVEFPRFDALGPDPDPEWLSLENARVEKRVVVEKTTSAATSGGATSNTGFMGALPSTEEAEPTKPSASMGFMGEGGSVGTTQKIDDAQEQFEIVTEEAAVRASVRIGDADILVTPSLVTLVRGGETYTFDIERDEAVLARSELPDWMQQRDEGGKVIAKLGFPGRVEIEDDAVKLRPRFLGWENFLFDPSSPFWGRSLPQVLGLIFFGDRIEPGTSNLALAADDIWNNAEWQHGDVFIKLLQTIVMAFVGTLFASIVAFPLAFIAARNITPNRVTNWVMKRFFDLTRSIDMLIWALFFTRAFGPGPLAGISAIFFTDTGTFGKLFSEALENIDDKQREGVQSVGANPVLVQRYGVVPQVLPVFVSQSLYFWESNTRSATIIGAVGAGGIGLKLWEAMRTNQDWENVAYMVLLILIVVFLFDNISNYLRSRLIGKTT